MQRLKWILYRVIVRDGWILASKFDFPLGVTDVRIMANMDLESDPLPPTLTP